MIEVDVICDSSPLILFAGIGRLQLLSDVFGEVIVPPAVWDEVITHGANRPDVAAIARTAWIRIVPPSSGELLAELVQHLDIGEAECIALAGQDPNQTLVVLDDKKERQFAQRLGIRTVGSIGIPLLAKDAGDIVAVKPIMEDLRAAGLYLSESVLHEALRLAGESFRSILWFAGWDEGDPRKTVALRSHQGAAPSRVAR